MIKEIITAMKIEQAVVKRIYSEIMKDLWKFLKMLN